MKALQQEAERELLQAEATATGGVAHQGPGERETFQPGERLRASGAARARTTHVEDDGPRPRGAGRRAEGRSAVAAPDAAGRRPARAARGGPSLRWLGAAAFGLLWLGTRP